MSSTPLAEFAAKHAAALERDEARYNLLLGILSAAAQNPTARLQTWTMGPAGACAIRAQGRPIVLGALERDQCRALAEETRELDYPGVVGVDLAPAWFVECAVDLGLRFAEPIPQRIHALRDRPIYPGTAGQARQVSQEDATLFADWLISFVREAVPHDPLPSRIELENIAGQGRHTFWVAKDTPVAMAGIARRSRTTGTITAVYTPPALRGRGYAGSVTAAVAERILAEGKAAVCLYTDLRNPASNRCYAKIGFKPVCDAWHYVRQG